MKIVAMYESDDGELFTAENDCLRHEQKCTDLCAANEMLANGANLLEVLEMADRSIPGWSGGLDPETKEVLARITNDTGFRIRYWQCSDLPAYKPDRVRLDGKVFLYGDVGRWSGPYGDWVRVKDLVRYYLESHE